MRKLFIRALDRKFRLFCHRQPFYKYLPTGQNVCSSCRMSKWTLLFIFSWSTLRYMYLCFLCNNKQEYSPGRYVLPASVATTICLFQRGFHQKAITEGHFQPKGQYQEVTFFRRSPSSLWAVPPPKRQTTHGGRSPPIGRSPPVGRSPEWTWEQAARQKLTSYPPSPMDRQTHMKTLSSHNFVAGGNYTLSLSTSLWSLLLLCVLLSWPNFCVKIYHGPHKVFFSENSQMNSRPLDILLYSQKRQSRFPPGCRTNHQIEWIHLPNVPSVIETSCAIDITNFPVDEQTCHFKVVLK